MEKKKKFSVRINFGDRSCSENRNKRDWGEIFLKNFGGGENVRLVPILETGPVPKSGIEEIGEKNFLKTVGGEDNFRLVPFSDTDPDPKTEIGEIGETFWGGGGGNFRLVPFSVTGPVPKTEIEESPEKKNWGRTNFWLVPFSETSPNPITEKGKKKFFGKLFCD